MENDIHLLVAEQQKTNQLLTHLIQENEKRNRSDRRHFWVGLLWHSIPLILTLVFLWYSYTYVSTQITTLQEKVTPDFNLNGIKDKIGTLFN